MVTKGRRRAALLMTVLLLVVATGLPALSAPSTVDRKTRDKQFRVKYEAGTEAIKKGARVRVRFEPKFIVCEGKKGLTFSIPTAGITEVGYDAMPWARSKAVLREGLPDGAGLLGPLYLAGVLAIVGVVAPIGGKDHFVRIAWKEDGGDEVVWFEVSKGRYAAFLAELERATGKKPLDLAKERDEKQRELRDKAETVEIELDRKLWVAGEILKPGRYQLVLLERTETIGELYFFRGKKVKPKHPETGAVVEIVRQASEISYPKVIFDWSERSSPRTVVEIQLPTKSLLIQ